MIEITNLFIVDKTRFSHISSYRDKNDYSVVCGLDFGADFTIESINVAAQPQQTTYYNIYCPYNNLCARPTRFHSNTTQI